MSQKVKAFSIALACGMVFSVLLSFARFNSTCDGIRDNVLRLHILANSDSTEDQLLKLQIRDRLVAEGRNLFSQCETKEQALNCLKENLPSLQAAVQQEAAERGYSCPVTLQVGKAHFETREYEDFTLPAGEYDALQVLVGEAEGQNWWCIMFPSFCIGAADAELPEQQAEVMQGRSRYRIRFKAVEIFEELRNMLKF